MKAAMNGALNLSILDGWWAEFAGDDYGWVIPSADAAGDAGERDALEAAALYELLEHHVATRYYERDGDGVPVEWVRRVRQTLATLAPELGADRMVRAVRRGALPPRGRARGGDDRRRGPQAPRARGLDGSCSQLVAQRARHARGIGRSRQSACRRPVAAARLRRARRALSPTT